MSAHPPPAEHQPETLTVPAWALAATIRRECEKARHYRFLPAYMFFMALLCGLLFATRVDQNNGLSKFDAHRSARRIMGAEEFLQVETSAAYYAWFEESLTRVFSIVSDPSGNSVLPVGLITLRQLRVITRSCFNDANLWILDPFSRRLVTDTCFAEVDGDGVKAGPFGGGAFLPNHDRNDTVHPPKITSTSCYEFNYPDDEFAVFFYLHRGIAQAVEQLRFLQNQSWINNATRAVAVDAFFCFPGKRQFIVVTAVLELTSSLEFKTSVSGSVFDVARLGALPMAFVFDVLVGVSTLVLFLEFCDVLRGNWMLSHSLYRIIGFWEVVTMLLVGVLVALVVVRSIGWATISTFDSSFFATLSLDESARKMVSALASLHDATIIQGYLFALSFMLAALQMLCYLQHVNRLNIITETLRHSLGDLVGLAVVFFWMLLVYASAGTILFGQHYYPASTFLNAFGYLTRLVVSADLSAYDELHQSVSFVVAALYIGSFFILFYFMLLNIVLGIIAAAFRSVRDRRTTSDVMMYLASSPILGIRRHFLLLGDRKYYVNRRMDEVYRGRTMSACVASAYEATKTLDSFTNRWKKYHKNWESMAECVSVLTHLADDTRIRRSDFALAAPLVDDSDRIKLFDRARRHYLNRIRELGEAETPAEALARTTSVQLRKIRDELTRITVVTSLRHPMQPAAGLPPKRMPRTGSGGALSALNVPSAGGGDLQHEPLLPHDPDSGSEMNPLARSTRRNEAATTEPDLPWSTVSRLLERAL